MLTKKLEEIIEKVESTGEVVVDVSSVNNTNELVLPSDLVTTLNEQEEAKQLTIVSKTTEIVMDEAVMETVANAVESSNDKISIKIETVDTKELNEMQQAAVEAIAEDAVIVELNMVVTHYDEKGKVAGETDIHELGGKVEVAVSYKLPAGKEDKHVVVAYVDDAGNVTYIRAEYVDGKVIFTTDHFSVYMVMTLKSAAFEDVDLNAWYAQGIEWAFTNGITSGTSATAFSPNAACTRAQAVTFLWRAAGSPAPVSTEMPFGDVTAGTYYYDAVLWAVENGITSGTSATTFAPNATCTRAQIVTFLWRSQGAPVVETENVFADVTADAYYYDAVLWAVENGITSGTSATTFAPNATCTRAHIVTFLYRNNH